MMFLHEIIIDVLIIEVHPADQDVLLAVFGLQVGDFVGCVGRDDGVVVKLGFEGGCLVVAHYYF